MYHYIFFNKCHYEQHFSAFQDIRDHIMYNTLVHPRYKRSHYVQHFSAFQDIRDHIMYNTLVHSKI